MMMMFMFTMKLEPSAPTMRSLTAGLLGFVRAIGTLRLPVAPPASRDTLAIQAGELRGGASLPGCSDANTQSGRREGREPTTNNSQTSSPHGTERGMRPLR